MGGQGGLGELDDQGGLGEMGKLGELGELGKWANFMNSGICMNTWSQHIELHESSINRLYECKPVKTHSLVKILK